MTNSTQLCIHCGAQNAQPNILCNDCGKPLAQRERTPKYATEHAGEFNPSHATIESGYKTSQNGEHFQVNPDPIDDIIEVDLTNTDEFISSPVENEKIYVDPEPLKAGRSPLLILGLLIFSILAAAFFYVNRPAVTPESELFGQAERSFSESNYSTALLEFNDFSNRFPSSVLAGLAAKRIAAIRDIIQADPALTAVRDSRVNSLVTAAELACKNKQFIMPEGENAVAFISEALILDPQHDRALHIQDAIVDFYLKKADVAFTRQQMQDALSYYNIILNILPSHTLATKRVAAINAIREQG